MRVALYARVSTKDKGQETENQLRQLRDFAIHSGWTIAAEYIDHESGKISDREQFQQMFEDASRRQFDVLLFWSLDRLSREGVLPTLQHLQRLTSYGIGYRSFTEQYFDSCGIFRDAVIAIFATVAKQERIRISEGKGRPDHRTQHRQAAGPSPSVRFPLPDRISASRRHVLARDRAGAQYPTQPRPGERMRRKRYMTDAPALRTATTNGA